MDKKLELLKHIEIFNSLENRELQFLAKHSEIKTYKQGTILFTKDDVSRNFFIVESGEVKITSDSSSTKEKVLASFIAGNIFGEYDLFEKDKRTASAVTESSCRLLLFPGKKHNIETLSEQRPEIFGKIYFNLITQNAGRIRSTNKILSEKSLWVEELKKQMYVDKLTGFFNRTYLDDELPGDMEKLSPQVVCLAVKPDDFKSVNDTFGHEAGDIALKLIAYKTKEFLAPGHLIIRYRGNEFLVILKATELAEGILLAQELHKTLEELDIGVAIRNQSLRLTFSIGIAASPDHCREKEALVQKAYDKLFEKRDLGGKGILVAVDEEQESLRFLHTIEIFSTLYQNELKILAEHLIPMECRKGDIICREGEEGNELFIVEAGKAGIIIRLEGGEEKEIAEISSGDFFGEMAFFESAPRSATCILKESGKILKLRKLDFLKLMKTMPLGAVRIMQAMLNNTSDRLRNTGTFLSALVRWGKDASRRAITDELTGVYNRRFLDMSLDENIKKAGIEKHPLSLIMADLDYFREVNEGYSHAIGDEYIKIVADVFKKGFRESDVISRYGGDEFTILLPETTAEETQVIAEQIRLKIMELDFLSAYQGPDITVSVSMGIASFPIDGEDAKSLRELADKALYQAKEGGRNRVVRYK